MRKMNTKGIRLK